MAVVVISLVEYPQKPANKAGFNGPVVGYETMT